MCRPLRTNGLSYQNSWFSALAKGILKRRLSSSQQSTIGKIEFPHGNQSLAFLKIYSTPQFEKTPTISGFWKGDSPIIFTIRPERTLDHLTFQIVESSPSIEDVQLFMTEKSNSESELKYRWAKSSTMKDILKQGFKPCHSLDLQVNNHNIPILLPTFEERTKDVQAEIDSIQVRESELAKIKKNLDCRAQKNADRVMWGGLALLCFQWGAFARLTWWEYSWDVMEPISYFFSFGTGILGYIFYVITRKEYSYNAASSLKLIRGQRNLYMKHGFNIREYEALVTRRHELETLLKDIASDYSYEVTKSG